MTKEKKSLVDTPLTDNVIDNGEIEKNPQLTLAALASMDNQGAREEIKSLIEPLISFQTDCFCKRFCGRNHLSYQCSLANPIIHHSNTAKLKNKRACEWGNASHHWMLDYLINKQRLLKFSHRHGDSLYDYFFQIINSLMFFQRWKTWRFGASGAPLAIQNMGRTAIIVFKGLQQHRKLSFIAEQTNLKLTYVEWLAEEIVQHLNDTHTYYLLQESHTPATSNATSRPKDARQEPNESEITALMKAQNNESNIASDDINKLWNKLNITEQFVIEATVINQQSEETVLYALKAMDIRIKEGVLPEDTTVEMLHDFKTDSLLKLAHHF